MKKSNISDEFRTASNISILRRIHSGVFAPVYAGISFALATDAVHNFDARHLGIASAPLMGTIACASIAHGNARTTLDGVEYSYYSAQDDNLLNRAAHAVTALAYGASAFVLGSEIFAHTHGASLQSSSGVGYALATIGTFANALLDVARACIPNKPALKENLQVATP